MPKNKIANIRYRVPDRYSHGTRRNNPIEALEMSGYASETTPEYKINYTYQLAINT